MNHNHNHMHDENKNNANINNQYVNNKQQIQNRPHSYSQAFNNPKRSSLPVYTHFNEPAQNSYANALHAVNTPPTAAQMRNRLYSNSFAYNDLQSYPPITFKNMNKNGIASQSNPMLHMNGINEMGIDERNINNNIAMQRQYNNSPPFAAQSHIKKPMSFSQLPVNGYNNGYNGQIQMQNSANSSEKSHQSKNSMTLGMFPPILTQSESNHENDGDIQAFIQETIKQKNEQQLTDLPVDDIIFMNEYDDDEEDDERAHSIEAMYEPGKQITTQTPTNNNNNMVNIEKKEKLKEQKEEKQMNELGNIDITNSDYLDCNPIEIMKDLNKNEADFMNSIAINIESKDNSNNNKISVANNNNNSPWNSSGAESRSRPTSIQSAVSSHPTEKWAIYGVGNNMSYEFGLNHNNNLSIFQQMDWHIDDNKLNQNNNNNNNDEHKDDEKKEIMDQQTNGIIYHKSNNVFNDCLGFMTNGPGYHMYLFGNGQLYCAGSNASGCFSMGKDKKGTYIQRLTQHTYFKEHNISLRYLSRGNSGQHSFVITDMNDIYALGESSHYELALDSEEMARNKSNYWPQRVSFFDKIIIAKIGTGKKFTIFVSGHGATYSCGTSLFGALGFGDEITTLRQPKVIDRIKRIKYIDICCGENHSVLLDANGKVWTFGINNQGQLGRNTKNNLDYPAVVHISGRKFSVGQSHSKMNKIACGHSHVAVISESCKVFLWGANERGQLGDGTQKVRYKAKQLLKNELIKDISCGSNHTVIITKRRKEIQSKVYVCGCNEYYQCQYDDDNNMNNNNKILKPRLLTFVNQPDIDQQIKRIFAGHNSTFVAVDTDIDIDRVHI